MQSRVKILENELESKEEQEIVLNNRLSQMKTFIDSQQNQLKAGSEKIAKLSSKHKSNLKNDSNETIKELKRLLY